MGYWISLALRAALLASLAAAVWVSASPRPRSCGCRQSTPSTKRHRRAYGGAFLPTTQFLSPIPAELPTRVPSDGLRRRHFASGAKKLSYIALIMPAVAS